MPTLVTSFEEPLVRTDTEMRAEENGAEAVASSVGHVQVEIAPVTGVEENGDEEARGELQERDVVLLASAQGPVVGAPSVGAPQTPFMHAVNFVGCALIVGMIVILCGSGFFWWTPLFRD